MLDYTFLDIHHSLNNLGSFLPDRDISIPRCYTAFAGTDGDSRDLNDHKISFGAFEVDLKSGDLRRKGIRLKLSEQPFKVLIILLERAGEVVTREDLRRQIWPNDVFVDFDQGLNKAINKVREVLGDAANNPRFIETIPRRGYRFIAPVVPSGRIKDSDNRPRFPYFPPKLRRILFRLRHGNCRQVLPALPFRLRRIENESIRSGSGLAWPRSCWSVWAHCRCIAPSQGLLRLLP
jgi:DNA-binding winged helix-turn-helix (wHTH) protein